MHLGAVALFEGPAPAAGELAEVLAVEARAAAALPPTRALGAVGAGSANVGG